jgi:hypothetical protein
MDVVPLQNTHPSLLADTSFFLSANSFSTVANIRMLIYISLRAKFNSGLFSEGRVKYVTLEKYSTEYKTTYG